jgi:hypothetical protein
MALPKAGKRKVGAPAGGTRNTLGAILKDFKKQVLGTRKKVPRGIQRVVDDPKITPDLRAQLLQRLGYSEQGQVSQELILAIGTAVTDFWLKK